MLPTVRIGNTDIDLDEWPPFRPLGFANQAHADLLGQMIGFARVTLNTGANDIFPRGGASAIPWNHMVQIQSGPVKYLAAILAGIPIPLENVMARELDLFLGHVIEREQHDHTRNPDTEGNGKYTFRVWLFLGKIPPLIEVVCLKVSVRSTEDNLCVALEQQHQSPSSGADINRLPEAVEHQYRSM